MRMVVHLNQVDKNGMIKYGFLNIPKEEASQIIEDVAKKDKIKIKYKTFLSIDIKEIEIAN